MRKLILAIIIGVLIIAGIAWISFFSQTHTPTDPLFSKVQELYRSGKSQEAFYMLEKENRLADYANFLEENLKSWAPDKQALEQLVIIYRISPLKDEEKETKYLRELMKYESSPAVMMNLAQKEANKGNTEQTYILSLASAEKDPENAVVYLGSGALMLENANDTEYATVLCQKALAVPGISPRGSVIISETLLRLRQYDAAVAGFHRTLNVSDPTIRQRSLLGICEIKVVQGQGESVLTDLQALSTDALSGAVRERAAELLQQVAKTS